MNTITLMTFGEFLMKQKDNDTLVAPDDYESSDKSKIGIINDKQWVPICFSPTLQDLTGAFVRSQIEEKAAEKGIKLTEEQINSARKGVEYWLTSEIGESINTAFDMLNLDREITIMDAWANRDGDFDFGDVFTDYANAIASVNGADELIKGYLVTGGKDIHSYCEDIFADFYESKADIDDILCEKNLLGFVTDLTV